MNINTYVSVNTSLFVVGLYSNITVLISVVSIYHALKVIKNSYKCGMCINKNIVLIVTLFLLLDAADIARFTLSY